MPLGRRAQPQRLYLNHKLKMHHCTIMIMDQHQQHLCQARVSLGCRSLLPQPLKNLRGTTSGTDNMSSRKSNKGKGSLIAHSNVWRHYFPESQARSYKIIPTDGDFKDYWVRLDNDDEPSVKRKRGVRTGTRKLMEITQTHRTAKSEQRSVCTFERN